MKFVLSKKWKIIISVCAFLLVVIIVLSSVLANLQYAKENFALFNEARDILLDNFEELQFGETQEPKMVINNENPMNLVNYYGDEDIVTLWNSLSKTQQEHTILLLIPGQIFLPTSESNKLKLEKWADTCEANQIPYCIQSLNGETHMEARPPIKYLEDRFAEKHNYFYGLNVASLYEGITYRGAAESDNSLYIIDMIKLCAKYGAFFIWTDTNLNYKNGMILDMLEGNESLYTTFKNYSKYICMLNKESIADPSTYAIMQGLWLCGLIGNWGVASDWWHWQNDGYKSLFDQNNKYIGNEWERIFNYPENMYVQSMMFAISRGGTCFSQDAPNFSISYNGKALAGFEYSLSPFLDRIMSKQIVIPTLDEVFAATNFAVLGRRNYSLANYSLKESNLYPVNGASGIVPLLPANLRKTERQMFTDRGVLLVDYKVSSKEFLKAFGQNDANTYLANTGQNWYFINNLENKQGSKYARFTPNYANSKSFYIEAEEHTSAIISESQYGFKVYLSNYRTDKSNMIQRDSTKIFESGSWTDYVGKFLTLDNSGNPMGVTDSALRKTIIEINGTFDGGEPLIKWNNHSNGSGANNRKYNVSSVYNKETQTLRLEIEHNGIVDFEISLDDSGKEYHVLRRGGINDNLAEINADTTALQKLVESKVIDKHNYTYFSYQEYDKCFEKALVMISEKTYTQKEIDSQAKLLTAAKDNLINIQKEVELLKNIWDRGDKSVAVMTEYDSLLRELLSCQKYINGRSNSLKYASIYKNKKVEKTFVAKRKAIKKAYDDLAIYA